MKKSEIECVFLWNYQSIKQDIGQNLKKIYEYDPEIGWNVDEKFTKKAQWGNKNEIDQDIWYSSAKIM